MDAFIEESTADHVLAVWDRVVIAVFKDKTSAEAIRRCEAILEKQHRKLGTPLLLLTVVDVAAPLPSTEVRTELVSALQRVSGKVARSAVLYEGEGFRAASVRAVVAGILLFSRLAYPHRVFGRVGGAVRFLVGGATGSPSPHQLIRAVHQVRATRGSAPSFAPWLPGGVPVAPALRTRQS